MARTQNDATRIQNIAVSDTAPTNNQTLIYNSSTEEYVPGGISSSTVTAPGATHTLDAMLTDALSSGWIEGGTIADAGGGNITVTAGECFIRATASETASLEYRDFAALTSTAIPTDTTRYVILTYASGTMTPSVSATNTSNTYNIIYLGEVHNIGGVLSIHNDHRPAGDALNRFQTAWSSVVGIRVNSGEVATESAALKLAVSAGALNDRFGRPITTAAFDSNVAGTFTLVYRNAGDWTRVLAQSTLPVTQYDDNSGTLATMTAGKYANLWVIRGINGDICVQYGQAEYATQALAEAESQPATRPEEYDEHGFYVAQLTFLKSAASLASITSIKPVVGGQFGAAAAATPTVHNDLSGLQGGTAAQYYHLTSAEYTGTGTNEFVRKTSPTLVTPALGTPSALVGTNISGTAASLTAGAVTNATLTTALTVNTGTVTLTGNVANTSVLTIGAGAVSVSGANTGDQTTISGNAGTATALQTARTIGGVSFDGTANITVSTATAGFTVSGGDLAIGANNLTLTGSIGATGARTTKLWATDIESTNMPTVGGTAILTSLTAPQFTTIELGAASDTTLSRVSAGVIAVEGATIPSISSTDTLTNKRITTRVSTTADSATPTPNGDTDDMYTVTALAQAATFGAPTGTPTNGQVLIIRVKDNATARALSFNAIYRFSSDLAAPTTTVLSKTLYLQFIFNSADSKWDCVGKLGNLT